MPEPMGPQSSTDLLTLLRECEATDGGVLYEGLAFDLVLQSVSARYNIDASLALDYNSGHVKNPFAPADDDRGVVNDVTVERHGGASVRLEQTDGPLGSDPATGVGRYETSRSLSLANDLQAHNHAGWILHLGTVDEYRYPQVNLMFHSSASILADWLTCDIGSRVTVDNMPANMPPDLVDQILEGYTERINEMEWHAQLNLSPYSPFLVGEYGADGVITDPDRYGVEGCVLFDSVDDNDTTFRVIPGERRWTTAAADFDPDLRLRMGGEVFDVSAIANAPTFVAAGTASAVVNAAATPGAPAGKTAGDCLFLFVGCSDAALTMPTITGWGQLASLTQGMLYGRTADGTATDTPTVTVSGIGANDTLIAQICAWRGVRDNNEASDLAGLTSVQTNSSAQDIATPGLTVEHDVAVVLMLALKNDDWTSVAAPSGFTEIGEPDLATGDDFGLWWGYQIQTDRASIQATSITVTGGAAATSRARLVSIRGLQTFTVSARSVNGVVKSHTASSLEVRLARDTVYAL